MTPIHYRTAVFLAPAPPLGLLPAEWKVEHRCSICRQPVQSAQLIDHAKSHAEVAQFDGGDVLRISTEGAHDGSIEIATKELALQGTAPCTSGATGLRHFR